MFTVVAFQADQDEAGVMTKIAGVPDQHVRVTGNQILIPALNQLIAAYAACGSTAVEARLVSPSLRAVNPLYISPLELVITPPKHTAMMYHGDSPIELITNEALEAENNANPAAAEVHTVLAWLADGAQTPLSGKIHTVNATLNAAQVVGAWSFSELIFPDTLPVGKYSVVGARLVAAGGVGFRFVPVGAAHRPGGVCAALVDSADPHFQRFGRLGEWFQFDSVTPPGIEILGSAAAGAATYDIFLDVIQL